MLSHTCKTANRFTSYQLGFLTMFMELFVALSLKILVREFVGGGGDNFKVLLKKHDMILTLLQNRT